MLLRPSDFIIFRKERRNYDKSVNRSCVFRSQQANGGSSGVATSIAQDWKSTEYSMLVPPNSIKHEHKAYLEHQTYCFLTYETLIIAENMQDRCHHDWYYVAERRETYKT
jgi:hypothetical protein